MCYISVPICWKSLKNRTNILYINIYLGMSHASGYVFSSNTCKMTSFLVIVFIESSALERFGLITWSHYLLCVRYLILSYYVVRRWLWEYCYYDLWRFVDEMIDARCRSCHSGYCQVWKGVFRFTRERLWMTSVTVNSDKGKEEVREAFWATQNEMAFNL